MIPNTPRIAFIGFGEAGQAFAAGLRESGVERIRAWDILFPEPDGERLLKAADTIGATAAVSAADAVRDADIVISAVTAASSLDAARSALPHLHDQYFLDVNSVSPGRKKDTAALVNGGARYVDVAVMAPVYPARHKTPLLLAGEYAETLAPILRELGMNVALAGPSVGGAAAIKMVRSVMMKGIEALTEECFVAAERAGVDKEVMASLAKSYPTLDWPKMVAYNIERMATHGIRRAAEMEEVATTLAELGVEPLMASATVQRQRAMGAIGKDPDLRAALEQDHTTILKAVNAAVKKNAPR